MDLAGPAASISVVLADDHARYREGLADAITGDTRLTLAEAVADGDLAVDAVRAHRPDVALLDVRMPGMGGLEAARLLRGDDVVVVVLSGAASPALEQAALDAGAVALWSKDLTRQELCTRLATLGPASPN